MYEAASQNYHEVEKGLKQLERAVNRAVRLNDESSVNALTRVQLLLTSVKAEARLTKIVYMPLGLAAGERSTVLGEQQALNRWKQLVDIAFRRHYKVPQPAVLADELDHDVLAKHLTLMDLIDNELELVISLRNKLAHGQWLFPFNTDLTAVEPWAVNALKTETSLSIRLRDRLIAQLANIMVDLVDSKPSFEARFNEYFKRVRRYRQALVTAEYEE